MFISKFFKNKKIPNYWKYISAFLIVAFLAPIVYVTSELNFVGRIIGFVVYLIIGFIAIFEVVNSMGSSKITSVYYSLLISIIYFVVLNKYWHFESIEKQFWILKNENTLGNFSKEISNFLSWQSILFVILMLPLPLTWDQTLKEELLKKIFIVFITIVIVSLFAKTFFVMNIINYEYLLFFVPIAIIADTSGYLGGKYLSKYIFKGAKLAPRISPKKTWAGFIVGYVVTGLFVGFVGYYMHIWKEIAATNIDEILFVIFTSLIFPIFPPLGDLLFSLIKRSLGIKDFSNFIPGHGGVLDRVDSMSIVFVISLFIFYIFSLSV